MTFIFLSISIVLVALNEKKDSFDELTGMLNVLFSMTMPAETKLNILDRRYHMDLAPDLKEEVNVSSCCSGFLTSASPKIF